MSDVNAFLAQTDISIRLYMYVCTEGQPDGRAVAGDEQKRLLEPQRGHPPQEERSAKSIIRAYIRLVHRS